MINVIVVDDGAAAEIIAERSLQSTEFLQGRILAEMLRSRNASSEPFSPRVRSGVFDDGLFFLGEKSRGHFLVFDLENTHLFREFTASDALIVFQRVCRFAVRIWDNLKLSSSERMIADSTKAAIFPFRLPNEYRVTVERKPDEKRGEKRFAGNHLLVYRGGYDEGGGALEVAEIKNFRNALRTVQSARSALLRTQVGGNQPDANSAAALRVTQLQTGESATSLSGLGFNEWLPYLTEAQRAFVRRPISRAERIEGPAGTGKTLSLVLRCIGTLLEAQRANIVHHSIFVAHSQATEKTIRGLFSEIEPAGADFSSRERAHADQSVMITTLQSWCASFLGERQVSENQFLDRDALESKELRLMYILESLQEVKQTELETHRPFLSPEFANFIDREDEFNVAEMIQHEISIVIKGRADENYESYLALARIDYNLPLHFDGDKGLVFAVFRRYRDKLEAIAQFDTDDVVLTTIGQLHTPIWRRRRSREGFDSIFIDETHLFNLNELSVFHHLTREPGTFPIIFSADRSQAPGDRGLTNALLDETIAPHLNDTLAVPMRAIFRCSPDITAVALSVTASGATLFTTFDNPLSSAASTFTAAEERLASPPLLLLCPTDEEMVRVAIVRAERMVAELGCKKAEVLVAVFGEALFELSRREFERTNKPVELLQQRADLDGVLRAKQHGRFVLSTADYVGGLEFQGAILLGVDEGRVPPTKLSRTADSRHFQDFRSHNRLYVAITRAKYRLEFLALAAEGPSPILKDAIRHRLVSVIQSDER
ncbi:UvrD-helicase domain-containing protein [Longimicrobium sp.]|uniref:UvrD-helicase domain-containing protein n=1 Tax=Longimicrobium sp. TaxID=2029185 RepID=UPI002C515701|nr:UvrD-helicase domain-containing protein [Longimicrobium sp.]HSU15881.1 UvrD-helicase domain-containing protein [Longimicrobium sp.]